MRGREETRRRDKTTSREEQRERERKRRERERKRKEREKREREREKREREKEEREREKEEREREKPERERMTREKGIERVRESWKICLSQHLNKCKTYKSQMQEKNTPQVEKCLSRMCVQDKMSFCGVCYLPFQ